jgi:hypothetical protein
MKSRKELGHTQIIQEAIELSKSRFAPTISLIKKCIEQLIDKGYLARSETHVDKYQYIA